MIKRSVRRILAVGLISLVIGQVTNAPAYARTNPGGCTADPTRKIQLITVPAVPRFAFTVGNRRYVTNSQGVARIKGVTCRNSNKALGVVTTQVQQSDGTTAFFDQWFAQSELGRSSGNADIYAEFRQQTQVRFTLFDLQGDPVPRSNVGDITLKGSTGAVVVLKPGQDTITLESSRVVRFSAGLVSKDIGWSVQSVEMNGNSVVDRGGVRFSPRTTTDVTLSLQLYPLTIQVHDAILKLGVGSDVVLTAPDGTERTISLSGSGFANVGLLARGAYTLRAHGRLIAVSFDQPVAMSRPQNAEITVVSYLDVLIFGGVSIGTALGLLLVGYRLRRRSEPGSHQGGGAPTGSSAPVQVEQGGGR